MRTDLPMSGCPRSGPSMVKDGLMSTSAAQADAFYNEALDSQTVWAIRDSSGFPAPEGV